MKEAEKESPKVFETSPIRLSADETRTIVKAANLNGKPICDYHVHGLVDMGILKRIITPPKDVTADVQADWKKIEAAAAKKDADAINRGLSKINELKRPTYAKDSFVLTALGKQVARGITVRLNGQYMQTKC